MGDERKTKKQLLAELEELRLRNAELKRTAVKVEQSDDEATYRLIADNVPQGVIITQAGRVVHINSWALEYFGVSREELTSRPMFDMVHPEDRDQLVEFYQAKIRGEDVPLGHEYRIVRANGEFLWVQSRSKLITWKGSPAILTFMIDVTELRRFEEAIRESEAILKSIHQAAPIGIGFVIGPERILGWTNERLAEMTGYSIAELLGMPASRLYPSQEEYERVGREKHTAVRARGVGSVETSWKRKDGTVFDLLLSSAQVDSNDFDAGLVFTALDLTDRKQAEEELKASEEKYRFVVENATEAIFINQDGVFKYLNPQAKELTGFVEDELISRPFVDLVHQDDLDTVRNRHLKRQEGKIDEEVYEFRIVSRDGITKLIEAKSVRFSWEGRPATLNLVTDITERKKREEDLRSSEERFRSVYKTAPLAFVIWDRDTKVIDWNEMAEEVFGWSKAEVVGQSFFDFLIPDEDRPHVEDVVANLLKGDLLSHSINSNLTKNGKVITCEWNNSILHDEQGNITGAISLALDITKRKLVEEALKENERWLKTILDSIQAAVVVHGPDTNIVLANPKAWELLGKTENRLLGKEARDPEWAFFGEDGRPLTVDEYPVNLVLAKSRPLRGYVGGINRLNKQGTRWVTLNADPVLDDQGNISHVIVAFMDITEQKESADRLRTEKERFQVLTEASPLGITLIDPDGSYNYANPRFVQMFGYDLVEVPNGREWFRRAFPDPKYRRQVVSTWIEDREEAEIGEARPRTFTVSCKDGSRKEIHFRPVSLEDGSQLVIYEDVTERKRAEQRLIDSEKRYRDLFQSVNDFIYSHDMEGCLLSVNPASARILGYIPEEMTGRPLSDFMLPQYRKAFHDNYLPQIKRQMVFNGVSVFLASDGTRRYIEYRNTLAQPGGQEHFVSGVGRDITERVLAEKDLKEMEKRLAHAQKMEAVGTLASGIAHDFNNLLQAISGYLELVQTRKITRAKVSRYLSEAENATERASELVRRLLTFSRRMERELEPVDLNRSILQAVKLLERTIPKMIRIKTRLDRNLKMTNGDAIQVEQIIMNLGANARDAMPDGGELIIQTSNITLDEKFWQAHPDLEPGEFIRLTVTDSGQGMDRETVDRIFEPFFTTKSVGEGTGLGLSTVYAIVKGYGGIITCYSQPGHGTTFEVYLPASDSVPLEVGTEDKAENDILRGEETILVVDDDSSVLGVAEAILTEYGYVVITADSGEQALGIFKDRGDELDLVVLDLNMPGMGGLACLEELIRLDPMVKVLVASGYASDRTEKQVRETGARGYIAKPYRLKDFVLGVREILDKG